MTIAGRFVYIQDEAGIDGFHIDDDGSLTAVPGSPAMVSNGLCAMAVDKNNAFLFATTPVTETNPPPSTVHVFQLDSNSGALTEVEWFAFWQD